MLNSLKLIGQMATLNRVFFSRTKALFFGVEKTRKSQDGTRRLVS